MIEGAGVKKEDAFWKLTCSNHIAHKFSLKKSPLNFTSFSALYT